MYRPVLQRALALTTHLRRICTTKHPVVGITSDKTTTGRAATQVSGASPVDTDPQPQEKISRKAESRLRNLEVLKRKGKALHPNQLNAKLDSQRGVEMFLDMENGAGVRRTGRAWKASELRLKSFDDLHRLWYILVIERNVLLTERAWCKTNGRHWSNGMSNLYKVRHSMARVKAVIAERVRAIRAQRARDALHSEVAGLSDTNDEAREELPDNEQQVAQDGTNTESDPVGDVETGIDDQQTVKKEGQHKNVNKNWSWKRRNETSKSGTPLYI